MSEQHLAHLIKMANQIAGNCPGQGDREKVVQATRAHLKKFWAPSMKRLITGYLARDGSELSVEAAEAIRGLDEYAADQETNHG